MPNDAMVEGWNGSAGEHWVQEADRYDRILALPAQRVVEALAPQPGERVLDVGCGTGALARALAVSAGRVVGVDISRPMLAEARRRAESAGLDNVEFVEGDAQVHEFEPGSFDAVASRFGVMFFEDPVAAFRNIGDGLRPGARLAFASWQEMPKNEWLMVPVAAALAHVPMPPLGEPGAPGPFAFADPDRVRSILGDAGFVDIGVEELPVPMRMGESVGETVAYFQRSDMAKVLFKEVDDETADKAWGAVTEALRGYVRDGGVVLQGHAWLVTARRA